MVLAIMGILAYAGVTVLGNPQGTAVRSLLDELEGCVQDAQRMAVHSGKDVALVSWGSADDMASLGLARGNSRLTAADIKGFQDDLVKDPPLSPGTELGKTVAPLFAFSRSREHLHSGIVVAGSNWWNQASGPQDGLMESTPFATDASFQAAAATSANLFQGGAKPHQVTINGLNGRFNNSFGIWVVGTTRSREVNSATAQGLLIVLGGGASIYKFYNPGSRGDRQWRRI